MRLCDIQSYRRTVSQKVAPHISYQRTTIFNSPLYILPLEPIKMLLTKRIPTHTRTSLKQCFSTSHPLTTAPKKRRVKEEIHRPSLSGSSVGHLFSEINAMRPGMEALRAEGMTEDQRTYARKTATWLMGVPVVLGTLIVGGNWVLKDGEGDTGK
jgi:hypothetical protein